MSTDDPAPSIETLNRELDIGGHRAVPTDPALDEIPPAPGEPITRPGSVAPVLGLASIAFSDPPGPHGSGIMDAVAPWYGQELSPGTIYPALRDLEDDGVLSHMQLVRSKHYAIADAEAADAELENYETRLRWWLGLIQAARDTLDTADTPSDAAESP